MKFEFEYDDTLDLDTGHCPSKVKVLRLFFFILYHRSCHVTQCETELETGVQVRLSSISGIIILIGIILEKC